VLRGWALPIAYLGLTLAVGYAAAQGHAPLMLVCMAALAVTVAVVTRPEVVLVLWFGGILVNGRWLTYHTIGPLFVTEVLIAILAAGLAARLMVKPVALTRAPAGALHFVALLLAALWIPALLGLMWRTGSVDIAAARNFAIVLYSVFAVVAVMATDIRRSTRFWFMAVVTACSIALVLVVTGNAGSSGATSTGAIRVAAHSFVLAFGIAPLVLAAAARQRLIRPLWGLLGALPFCVGLIFVNHRSAWIAFVAALGIIFARRVSPIGVVAVGAVAATAIVLFTAPPDAYRGMPLGPEIERAKSITDEDDPNRRFRLAFWSKAMAMSAESPLIGNGFDAYPASIVPPSTSSSDWPAPHNSFVGIGYRVGLLPLLVVLGMLLWLVGRGFIDGHRSRDRRERAILLALSSSVVYIGVAAAFNVFLEAPYAGPLFWGAVGLLATAVFAARSPNAA
jgi:O-antigen ligase